MWVADVPNTMHFVSLLSVAFTSIQRVCQPTLALIMTQSFPDFPLLPTELRQTIFSKMRFSERIQMSRASREAFRYLEKFRIEIIYATLYVGEVDGMKSINVNVNSEYEERHRLNEEMTNILSKELNSYEDCECCWCQDRKGVFSDYDGTPSVVHKKWRSIDKLFYFWKIANVFHLRILTEPYGGLMETLQPGPKITSCRSFDIIVHEKKSDVRQQLDLEKWSPWFEFVGATCIEIRTPMLDSTCCLRKNIVKIDSDFLNCEQIRNACSVSITGCMGVDFDKLEELTGMAIVITLPHDRITNSAYWDFHKRKVKKWIADPSRHLRCSIFVDFPEGAEFAEGHWCLVECIREMLNDEVEQMRDLIVYEEFDCLRDHKDHALCLRHLKTNTILRITSSGLVSLGEQYGDAYERTPPPQEP